MMKNVLAIHDGDPNFPFLTLQKIKEFLSMSPYKWRKSQAISH